MRPRALSQTTRADSGTPHSETVELEAPGSLFPLIAFLASHPHSTKFLRDPLSPLSQHRAQRLANAGINPVFAPEGTITPAETFALLEACTSRSMLVRDNGVRSGIRLALANRETTVLLEGMRRVWEEREGEVGAAGAAGETAAATAEPVSDADEAAPSCESWIDVSGTRACSEDEFWNVVGLEQKDKSTPIELPEQCVLSLLCASSRSATSSLTPSRTASTRSLDRACTPSTTSRLASPPSRASSSTPRPPPPRSLSSSPSSSPSPTPSRLSSRTQRRSPRRA